MERVLVTGGAGYIGSTLVHQLLDAGYAVRVLDNLTFGGESLLGVLDHPAFEFVHGDVRDESTVRSALEGCCGVVHLAAIVGDPACAREPELAREINENATKTLYRLCEEAGVERFVFASTCSNYGRMDAGDGLLSEDAPLRPVSLYAETKVAVERFLLEQPHDNRCAPTSLRFSTVYGIAPRVRFDLTVNDFTRDLVLGRELVVFGEQFWRPYCHVRDLARSALAVLQATREDVAFDVFNVGSSEENYQKKRIVELILEQVPQGRVRYVHKEEDPRDYRVSFEKIAQRLGFRITRTVPQGIAEVKQVLDQGFLPDPDAAKYANVPQQHAAPAAR